MIPRLNKSVRRIDDGVLEVVRIQIISVVRRIVLESLSEGGVKNVLILPLQDWVSKWFERIVRLHPDLFENWHRIICSIRWLNDTIGWITEMVWLVFHIVLLEDAIRF